MRIYDNGGKTVDRYTVIFEDWYNGKSCDAYGFSEDAKSPMGFNMFLGDVYEDSVGKEITFDKLPKEVQRAVIERQEGEDGDDDPICRNDGDSTDYDSLSKYGA